MFQVSFLMPGRCLQWAAPLFWLLSLVACIASPAKLLQLNIAWLTIWRLFFWLQYFPLSSSKKQVVFCFVCSGNNIVWVLMMIYVPFSSRILENYLEDMNSKHFFIFSSDFNCYDICPQETVRRKEGGKGKPFMAYCDPYGKNIYFPHIWFNTVCTFVRHMWKNAKRGEFLWKQTDYMAKNLSVEVRFIYCIVNCMFWYCIGDQDVWGNVELCLVKPTRDSQSIHVSCFSCVTRNPSAECIVPVSCT